MRQAESMQEKGAPQSSECAGGMRRNTALPAWISDDLIQRTIEVWNPYYGGALSEDDALTILLNASRLIDVFARR